MSGRLTTHVLDIGSGRPAAGMDIELYYLHPTGGLRYVCSARTRGDGRTGQPLLADGQMIAGIFELLFQVGDYYRQSEGAGHQPLLWESVPVRFTIPHPGEHVHIPLLIAPGGYSTYRGS
ncbi:hydroxyisourate hydrolase [Paenibacillus sp. 1P07SE]|uniref:hydroxyisourate hydrolase n=1 Tax=Paenibacillus sp. 1P07SE TaxID=3132209 RepID=UPI0039A6DEA8